MYRYIFYYVIILVIMLTVLSKDLYYKYKHKVGKSVGNVTELLCIIINYYVWNCRDVDVK